MAYVPTSLKAIGGQNNVNDGGDVYSYVDSETDGLAVILVADYFLVDFKKFNIGDIIRIESAEGSNDVKVLASTSGGVTVAGVPGDATVGLTADAGSIQGGLPILTDIWVVETVGSGGDSTTLPVASLGRVIYVANIAAANSMDVFPAVGGQINNGATNAAQGVVAGATGIFVGISALDWVAIVGTT